LTKKSPRQTRQARFVSGAAHAAADRTQKGHAEHIAVFLLKGHFIVE